MRIVRILVIFLVLIALIIGSVFFYAKQQTDERLNDTLDFLRAQGMQLSVTTVKASYRHKEEIWRVQLPGNMDAAFKLNIHYGPLLTYPGKGRVYGLTFIETTLAQDSVLYRMLEPYFGSKLPFQANSFISLDNKLATTYSSPAFKLDEDGMRVVWEGMNGKVQSTQQFSQWLSEFALPLFVFLTQENALLIKDVSEKARYNRSGEKTGNFNEILKIGLLKVSEFGQTRLSMNDFDLVFNIDMKDILTAIRLGMAWTELKFENETFNKMAFDFVFDNLDSETLLTINDLATQHQDDIDSLQHALLQNADRFAQQLLSRRPRIAMEKLSMGTPYGNIDMNFSAQIGGASVKSWSDILSLIASLDVKLYAIMPEEILRMLVKEEARLVMQKEAAEFLLYHEGQRMPVPKEQSPAEIEAKLEKVADKTLAELRDNDVFIRRPDNTYELQIVFKDGEILLNGRKASDEAIAQLSKIMDSVKF